MTHKVALCVHPLPHCHTDCFPHLRARAGNQWRQLAGILHANSAAKGRCGSHCGTHSGRRSPGLRPTLALTTLPSPKGRRWLARLRLAHVGHKPTARFTSLLADSHGTSCPGLMCSALGYARARGLCPQSPDWLSLSSLIAQTHACLWQVALATALLCFALMST